MKSKKYRILKSYILWHFIQIVSFSVGSDFRNFKCSFINKTLHLFLKLPLCRSVELLASPGDVWSAFHTVDGSEIRREHQVRLVAYPTIYKGFWHLHPRVLFGILAINSIPFPIHSQHVFQSKRVKNRNYVQWNWLHHILSQKKNTHSGQTTNNKWKNGAFFQDVFPCISMGISDIIPLLKR